MSIDAEALARLRPRVMWAVSYGNGWIDPDAVKRTRRQAIDAFVSDPGMPDWNYWRKIGCRAIKVRIVPCTGGAE